MAHKTPSPGGGGRYGYAESPTKRTHGRDITIAGLRPKELGRTPLLLAWVNFRACPDGPEAGLSEFRWRCARVLRQRNIAAAPADQGTWSVRCGGP